MCFDRAQVRARGEAASRSGEEQKIFTGFRAYYSFEARYCNPASGNEKGGVEGLVGYPIRVICRIDELEFFSQGKHVVTHRRQYGNSKWQLDPDHYLELLRERPLAFD
ncbi:MAG: hypothetical protein KFF77_11270, partial [Bacteroidetes bacterium]|nr:hypothetical protein [Bacteroidota bacterium]